MLSKYVHVLSIKISLPPLFTPPIIHSMLVEILLYIKGFFLLQRTARFDSHGQSPGS